MRVFGILLYLLAALVAVASASPVRYPMDLYLLADSSRSISVANWKLIANFANNLQAIMAEYALGYYQNSTVDGLRVSVLAFHCAKRGETVRFKQILKGPTGDEVLIKAAIQAMKKMVPVGETCASGGLDEFNRQILASRAALGNNGAPRPSAVVLLTDGVITQSDLQRTTDSAAKLLQQGGNGNSTQMFLINYGGGKGVMNQWGKILGGEDNIFQSTDLDQLAQVITALMLGNLQVVFSPSPQQQQEQIAFSAPNNNTVCSRPTDSVARFYVEGKITTLFELDQIGCRIWVNNSATPLTALPYRVGQGMYCDAPVLGPGRTDYSISMHVLVETVQKSLFTPVNLTVHTMPCYAVRTLSGDSGNSSSSSCFPGLTAVQQNTLLVYGPTVELPSANASSSYSCRFDSSPAVSALYSAELQGYTCLAPSLDVGNALLQGTSPSPYKQFAVLQGQRQVLASTADEVASQQACVDWDSSASAPVSQVCWKDAAALQSMDQLVPAVQGESIAALLRDYADDVEFTCAVEASSAASVLFKRVVPAVVDQQQQQVRCALEGVDVWSLLPQYQSEQQGRLTVAVQVRRKLPQSGGDDTRGWWVLKTLQRALPRVSPCLTYTLSSTCVGQSGVVLQLQGAGISNFVLPGQFACRVGGEATAQVAADGQCVLPVPLPFGSNEQQRMTLVSGALSLPLPQPQPSFSVCAQADGDYPQSHCFVNSATPPVDDDDFVPNRVAIAGPSAHYLYSTLNGLACSFVFDSSVEAIVVPAGSNGSAVTCNIPQWRPAQVALPLSTTFTLRLVTSRQDDEVVVVLALPGAFQYDLAACFSVRQPRCLEPTLRLSFQGEGTVSYCEFTSSATSEVVVSSKCEASGNWVPGKDAVTRGKFTSVTVYGEDGGVVLLRDVPLVVPPVCVQVTPGSGGGGGGGGSGGGALSAKVGAALPAIALQGQTLQSVLNNATADAGAGVHVECRMGARAVRASTGSGGGGVACAFPQRMYEPVVTPELSLYLVGGGDTGAGRRRLRSRQLQQTNGVLLYSTVLGNVSIDTADALAPFAALKQQCYDSAYALYDSPASPQDVECQVQPNTNNTAVWQSCKQPLVEAAPLSKLPYRLVILQREDNNQSMVLEQGQVTVCAVPATTKAPTTSSTPATDSDDGLSAGAIAGIVVGVVAFLCLLLLLLLMCCCRRRSQKKQQQQQGAGGEQTSSQEELKQRALEREESLLVHGEDDDEDGTLKKQPEAAQPAHEEEEEEIVTAHVVASPPPPPQVIVKSSTNNEEVVFVDLPTRRNSQTAKTTSDEPPVVLHSAPAIPPPPPTAPASASSTSFEFKSGDLVERLDPNTQQWSEVGVVMRQVDADTVLLAGGGGAAVPRRELRRLDTAFQVGENVEELGRDGEWRPAVVTAQRNASQYSVDGPGGTNLVRTQNHSLRFPQYRGGDLLEYRALGTSQAWRRITVVGIEPNGVVVALEDGEVDPKRVPNRLVRRRAAAAAAAAAPASKEAAAGTFTPGKRTRADLLDFEELPDFCFQLTVDKSRGLGVRLGWTKNAEIVVQSFLTIAGLGAGPLEESERVNLGDQLLAVNGVSVGGRSFAEVSDMIRQSGSGSGDQRIKLKFGRWADTLRMRGVGAGGGQVAVT